MKNYIKDTDFLPNVKDVSNDVYKLLYGVPKLMVETKIYDAITLLCRKYPDNPLRCAKIKAWKSAISDTIERLIHLNREEDRQIYIPYFERLCSVDSLINLYRFTNGVLSEMEGLPRVPEYRRGTSKEAIQLFFPFGSFVDVMREFGKKCAQSGEYPACVEVAIEKELEKRGMVASSTSQAEQSYDEIFFKGEILPSIQVQKGEEDDDDKRIDGGDWTTQTGFIYYALEKYFKEVYDNRYKKEEVFGSLLKEASFHMASGLFKPGVPIKGKGRIPTSNNVFYQYVNKIFANPKEGDKRREGALRLFKEFI